MGKYDPLYNYLSKRTDTRIKLTFTEIESMIGDKLPISAKRYPAWWSNSQTEDHPHSRSWLDANYKTVDVGSGIDNQYMVFERYDDNDMIISEAIEYISELFAGNSDGHGADHTMRVYHNTQLLLEAYPEADGFVSLLAALLHDADDHKLFNTENNMNARSFMERKGLPSEKIEQVCGTINSVSFSHNRGKSPETLEGKIVQDADRLDAIGAIGIARTFAYGGKAGRPLTDSIEHFYDKLLLLKDELNTDVAKDMAQKRHEYMVGFLEEYFVETGYRYEG